MNEIFCSACLWVCLDREPKKDPLCHAVFLCVGSWSSDQARRHTRPDLGASLLWVHSTECHCSFRNKGRMWPVPYSCRAQTSTRAGLIWCQLCVSSASLADSCHGWRANGGCVTMCSSLIWQGICIENSEMVCLRWFVSPCLVE